MDQAKPEKAGLPRVKRGRRTAVDRLVDRSVPQRIQASVIDHKLWLRFNLRLLFEGKTLHGWVAEQIRELNSKPLGEMKPLELPPELLQKVRGRGHYLPVRVDAEEYQRARWRWDAMGVTMTNWFRWKVWEYAKDVDLDAAEQAVISEQKLPPKREEGDADVGSA